MIIYQLELWENNGIEEKLIRVIFVFAINHSLIVVVLFWGFNKGFFNIFLNFFKLLLNAYYLYRKKYYVSTF